MINLIINDKKITVAEDTNILDAAKENNIFIPHLCYDKRLEAYGGCGMCVVELEGMPKLIRSCATLAREGMVIKTHTKRTESTRKTALDMFVSDHRGDCRPPCVMACPSHTDVQGYIGLIANREFDSALRLIKEQLPLPASIGRVCPHPCETECRRDMVDSAVSIACAKIYPADKDLFENESPYLPSKASSTGKSIAVIGAGPAGLTAAYYLAVKGHNVEIFEMMDKPGGMLRYGIPEYRLPKKVVDAEVAVIESLGVKINYNVTLGKDTTITKLKEKFHSVFLGIGAWKSSSMRCKGEDSKGVLGGIDFLRMVTNGESIDLGKKVIVVGGGNTAMDVARTAVRLGADTTVLYRRTEEQMPAEDIEIKEAKEEGVKFEFLVAPISVVTSDGLATGIDCQSMKLGEADASGRRRPMPIEGDTKIFEASTIIAAIGQQVDMGTIDVGTTEWNTIKIEETTYTTNIDGVFAGGDAVTGPKIAIDAVAQGKEAAIVIDSYLNGAILPISEINIVRQTDITPEKLSYVEKVERLTASHVSGEVRKNNFEAITKGFTEEEVVAEANRCLECGCNDYFECQLITNIEIECTDTSKDYGEKHDRNTETTHKYIDRNPDKCIQCGLCVRICSEVVGASALGLMDRGFDAVIVPEFGMPLENTTCVSCGQCVDVCPTGTLREKLQNKKEIPLNLEIIKGSCTDCDLNCPINYHCKNGVVYKTSSDIDSLGLLCTNGKFLQEDKLASSIENLDISPNFDKVSGSDLIVVIGDIYKEFSPMAVTIKDSSAKIISISDEKTLMDRFADTSSTSDLKVLIAGAKNPIVVTNDLAKASEIISEDKIVFLKKTK